MKEKIKSIDHLPKRIVMCILGVLIGGISVGLFKRALLGVDPFQAFMAGLDVICPISFGTLYVIANAVLLIFSLIFDRHYLGLATFINLFLLGYVVDFSESTMYRIFPNLGVWGRIVCFVIGFVVICFASSLYMTADLGVSTYDAVALIISGTWKKGKFKYVRIATDVVCVVIGAILCLLAGNTWGQIFGSIGVGTIITAFGMGPLIDFFNRIFAIPVLYGKQGKTES